MVGVLKKCWYRAVNHCLEDVLETVIAISFGYHLIGDSLNGEQPVGCHIQLPAALDDDIQS